MVGQTTEQPLPKDVNELEEEIHRRLVKSKTDIEKLGKVMYETETELKMKQAEFAVLEDTLYLIQHIGERTGPNRKKLTM